MHTQSLCSLCEVAAQAWNALLAADRNPFLRHEFLVALERHQCVGPRTGWLPRHSVCFNAQGQLVGAAPMYLKGNSYGEFVFDWGWAEAYKQHGLAYYPKLVSAIPFTPATGRRLLISTGENHSVAQALIEHTLEDAARHRFSSVHWLFPSQDDLPVLLKPGLLHRLGCQFHWRNRGYRDFDDFLATLSSKKRKNIKRERRLVQAAGLQLQVLAGSQVSESQWHSFHHFYRSTFQRLGGIPTLTLPFFQEIATTMGEQIVLILAEHGKRLVAGALCFRSDHTLYGRHWGCAAEHDSLHFEACYYQGINYCIEQGLQSFEPGAQGEHKVYRGFLPTLTHSAHWIADRGFREAIADFLQRESAAVNHYLQTWIEHSPYRQEPRPNP